MTGSYVKHIFIFFYRVTKLFQSVYNILYSYEMCWEFQSSTSSPVLSVVSLFNFKHFNWCFLVSDYCISLIANYGVLIFFFFFLDYNFFWGVIYLFYCSIVDLQCCVNFYCTAQWPSPTHIYTWIYIYILFLILSSIMFYPRRLDIVPYAIYMVGSHRYNFFVSFQGFFKIFLF